MHLLENFIDNIKQNDLFSPKDKLLLAVSGGVDSVVLCELCKQAGYDFAIAHCNFRLRDKESERDKEFVAGLAKKYKVEFFVKDFDTNQYALDNKISVQEAARELRYNWFAEIVNGKWKMENGDNSKFNPDNYRDQNLKLLLTAHHSDDNAETLLMNFCRGTGLHGLTGIPVSAGYIRRPLLLFSKDQLIEFAKEHKLDYVEDSSNQSSKYTRNLFRNEIIPAIAKVFPQVKENLQDNIERFKEIEALYRFTVDQLIKKLVRQKESEVHFPVKQLLGFENRALIYEIISRYGFSEKQVDEVIKLCTSGSGKYISNSTHQIIKHRHWLIISPLQDLSVGNIMVDAGIRNLELGIGSLTIEVIPNSKLQIPNSTDTACIDMNHIQFPLLLRKWKTGDYFYPLGMKKKKKLSRFFIDQKLSKASKEKTWVIEMNGKIVWVVGHRIDERFKITENTKEVLRLTIR